MNNIVLIGFSQCGKTTVGKLLAEKTQQSFVELETEIENEYHQEMRDLKAGMTPEEFKAIGKNALEKLIGRKNKIIAVSSELVEDEEIAGVLPKIGTVVFLQTDREEIERRLGERQGTAPEPDVKLDEEVLSARIDGQESLFFQSAGIIIQTAGKTPEAIVDEILLLL